MFTVIKNMDISSDSVMFGYEDKSILIMPQSITGFDLIRKITYFVKEDDRLEFLVESAAVGHSVRGGGVAANIAAPADEILLHRAKYTIGHKENCTPELHCQGMNNMDKWWGMHIRNSHDFEKHPYNEPIHNYLNDQTVLYKSNHVWATLSGKIYVNVSGFWVDMKSDNFRKNIGELPTTIHQEIQLFKNFIVMS